MKYFCLKKYLNIYRTSIVSEDFIPTVNKVIDGMLVKLFWFSGKI